jgi:LysM repeat protein
VQDSVFTFRADAPREPLTVPDRKSLTRGDGIDVDQTGRAFLRFADLLTVEVLREGKLVLRQLSAEEQNVLITLLESFGILFNNFNPQEEVNRRLHVETSYGAVEATSAEFMVAKESNTPLEWVIVVDVPAEAPPPPPSAPTPAAGTPTWTPTSTPAAAATAIPAPLWIFLMSNAEPADSTGPASGGTAYWIAPIGAVGPPIPVDPERIRLYLHNSRLGVALPEPSQFFMLPASFESDMSQLTALPATLQGVSLILLSGTYQMQDCNGDGLNDVYLNGGKVQMDFRQLLERVDTFNVSVLDRTGQGQATLRVFNPGYEEVGRATLRPGAADFRRASASPVERIHGRAALQPDAASIRGQLLDLSSEQILHYAELEVADGCLLRFGTTLPEAAAPLTPTPTPTRCYKARPAGWVAYRVVAGDTLSGIAVRTRTTVARLKQVNCLASDKILIGQLLYVPAVGPADLVIADFRVTGPLTYTGVYDSYNVPLRVVVRNRGGRAAGVFKVSVAWNTIELWHGFSSASLPAFGQASFAGTATVDFYSYGSPAQLAAIVDSCLGDYMPANPCRVTESNEGNNTASLSVAHPTPTPLPTMTPTLTLTPTPMVTLTPTPSPSPVTPTTPPTMTPTLTMTPTPTATLTPIPPPTATPTPFASPLPTVAPTAMLTPTP